MHIIKTTYELRPGDIVAMGGGTFRILDELHESQSHRPEGYWPEPGVGPSSCVACFGVCLSGSVPGYFAPGSTWVFQGNHRATWTVVQA
jgi:hypothetical protein